MYRLLTINFHSLIKSFMIFTQTIKPKGAISFMKNKFIEYGACHFYGISFILNAWDELKL